MLLKRHAIGWSVLPFFSAFYLSKICKCFKLSREDLYNNFFIFYMLDTLTYLKVNIAHCIFKMCPFIKPIMTQIKFDVMRINLTLQIFSVPKHSTYFGFLIHFIRRFAISVRANYFLAFILLWKKACDTVLGWREQVIAWWCGAVYLSLVRV